MCLVVCFDDCGRLFVICVVHFDLLWFGWCFINSVVFTFI